MSAEQSSRPLDYNKSVVEDFLANMRDFNERVVEEFLANDGKVGGPFAGSTMLLLTTTGAKTGKRRTVPLVAIELDGATVVIGSKGGADTHPNWYHNIRKNPEVTVEVGSANGIDRYHAVAEIAEPRDRNRLFAEVVERAPAFAGYQASTRRVIPVVTLRQV
ncbi:nitroreductase/quinone reductase family protein [Actinophytocola sediminis]